jgi:phage repressor protein C with HTH and peptisase S24 domain
MHNASVSARCLLHDKSIYFGFMSDASERLKQARVKAGYDSAKGAAEAMGVSVPTYIQHENGIRGYPAGRAARYARFFRVKPEWLLYGKAQADTVVELGPRLYVVGKVAAGVFSEQWRKPESDWEAFTGRSDITAPLKDRFGLEVAGDSMNLVYPEGAILECVWYFGDEPIPNGKRVIVQRTKKNGTLEATVKELVRDGDGIEWLVPRSSNPVHQAFRGDQPGEGITRVEIIAVVVASIRPE